MVRLSKKKVDNYVWNKLFYIFFVVLNKKRNNAEFTKFILSIFSYPEEIMLIKRIGIIYLIMKNYDKNKITQVLNVSKTTIDKYRLIIEKNKNIYEYFIKIIEKEKISNIFEEIFSTLYGPGTYGIDWKSALIRKKKISERKIHGF